MIQIKTSPVINLHSPAQVAPIDVVQRPVPMAPRMLHHSPSTSTKRIQEYGWTLLLVVKDILSFLLKKIKECFDLFIEQLYRTSQNKETEGKDLFTLFDYSIDYNQFRDDLLSYKRKNRAELFYNNYYFKSYKNLKDEIIKDKIKDIENCNDEDKKDLLAGIAQYDAIVDLYLQRFLIQAPEMNKEPYLSALRFTALCIAVKDSFDAAVYNSDFQQFLQHPLPVRTHNKMEMEFLKKIEWDVSLSEIASIRVIDSELEEEVLNLDAVYPQNSFPMTDRDSKCN